MQPETRWTPELEREFGLRLANTLAAVDKVVEDLGGAWALLGANDGEEPVDVVLRGLERGH